MGKIKKPKEKEMQEKLNRLNSNIEECEKTRQKMEEVIERYEDAIKEVEVLKETYESLISTHNNMIGQLISRIDNE